MLSSLGWILFVLLQEFILLHLLFLTLNWSEYSWVSPHFVSLWSCLVFQSRLIVVPLSIITIYLKYDMSFVTGLLPCKLICNMIQPVVFVLDTLTSLSLYDVCSSPLSADFWLWVCKIPALSNHWYLDIVSLGSQLLNICIPEP